MKRQAGLNDFFTLELEDKWNKFCVKFNMVYPIEHYGGEVFVEGLKPDLRLKMEQPKKPRSYFEQKYGKQLAPFTASFDFHADEIKFEKDENGAKFFYCKYNYAVVNKELSIDKVERHSDFRCFKIIDPQYYSGKFRRQSKNGYDSMFLVNGYAEKDDSNFMNPF